MLCVGKALNVKMEMSGQYYFNVGYHTLETKRCLNYDVLSGKTM